MGGVALLAASDVRAQTTAELLIERFDSLCVDTLADRAAVRDAADAMGWMPAPEDFFSSAEGINYKEVWILSSRDAVFFGVVTDMYLTDEVAPMKTCSIAVMPKPQGLAEALDRYAGGARLPDFNDDERDFAYGFLIVDSKAQPAPAMSDEATMAAIESGEMHVALLQDRPDMGMITYMAPGR